MPRLTARLFGWGFAVVAEDDRLLEQVAALLLPGSVVDVREPAAEFMIDLSDAGFYTLRSAAGIAGGWSRPDEAALGAVSMIELEAAASTADFIAIHAGVAAVDGKVIIAPGRSHSGKTSLTVALVGAGATYYSDEYALLDDHGLVHPYPRSLRVRQGGGLGVATPVADLHGRPAETAGEPAVIAHLQYDADQGWAVVPMSAGDSTLALLDNAVQAQVRPEAALNACSAAARRAVGIRGSRGDAAEAAQRLLDMAGVAGTATEQQAW